MSRGAGARRAPAANQGGLMRIAVLSETDRDETRVAATPEVVKKYAGLGFEVAIETGAGSRSGLADGEYETAGAIVAASRAEALREADVVLAVRRPGPGELEGVWRGALVVAQ